MCKRPVHWKTITLSLLDAGVISPNTNSLEGSGCGKLRFVRESTGVIYHGVELFQPPRQVAIAVAEIGADVFAATVNERVHYDVLSRSMTRPSAHRTNDLCLASSQDGVGGAREDVIVGDAVGTEPNEFVVDNWDSNMQWANDAPAKLSCSCGGHADY